MGKTQRRNPQHFGMTRERYVEKKVRRDYNGDLRRGHEYVRVDPQERIAKQRAAAEAYAADYAAYLEAVEIRERRWEAFIARANDTYGGDAATQVGYRWCRRNPAPQRPYGALILKYILVPFDGRPFADYLGEKGAEYGERFDKAHRDGQAKSDIRYGRGVGEIDAKARRVWDRNMISKIVLDPEVAENVSFSPYKEGKKHYWDWY